LFVQKCHISSSQFNQALVLLKLKYATAIPQLTHVLKKKTPEKSNRNKDVIVFIHLMAAWLKINFILMVVGVASQEF